MKIRNKQTGRIHEVMEGTLYSKEIFEEVKDEDIIVGEPKVEYEIEEIKDDPVMEEATASAEIAEKGAQSVSLKKKSISKKLAKKGAKKNGNAKTKSN